jgi:hypothetical protein
MRGLARGRGVKEEGLVRGVLCEVEAVAAAHGLERFLCRERAGAGAGCSATRRVYLFARVAPVVIV